MSESGMAVGFDEMSEKVSVDGRAEPVPELPTTAVPELAPEAAPEVAEAAEDALLAVAEDVAWRARRAAASWADAATSAGPRSRRDKARGDFMEGPSWRFDKDRGGLGRGQKKTGATVARRPSAIYSSPYHTPNYPSLSPRQSPRPPLPLSASAFASLPPAEFIVPAGCPCPTCSPQHAQGRGGATCTHDPKSHAPSKRSCCRGRLGALLEVPAKGVDHRRRAQGGGHSWG